MKKKQTDDKKRDEEPVLRPDTKKDTKKLVIAALFIVGLFAIFFISKYIFSEGKKIPSYTYNGFEFVKMQGLWHTNWQRENEIFSVHLRYGPKESEDIPLLGVEEDEKFNVTDELYITFDPGLSLRYVALAASELSLNLLKVFDMKPIGACNKNLTTACHDRPIITCDNTDEAVVYLKEEAPTKITLRSNCIIIQGEGEELVRAADKVIWIQYGIIT